ncbi:uncharacterized protein LOC133837311 [Drosophila sulfurigaster albostrigata]|uniref:uncharacterized protein LOC133837311 n=1 Tax=Drosophila sulfurigaster albostrigata TaxID=89887 RepID=UPI002D21D1AF|nr:uncharacterized protein LOC133837311 [Drosophila sulfurigaster albostrigata]
MSLTLSRTTSIDELGEHVQTVEFGTNLLSTQINCVIRVLKESIEIVKISLILPHILENPDEARSALKGSKYEPALKLLEDYTLRRDMIIRAKIPPLSDHGMIKIIDFFQNNYKIYELFPNLMKKISFRDKYFLITFERLYNICEHHLLRSSKKEIHNERQLNAIYLENETIKRKIEKLKEDLAKQIVRERWKMAAKIVYLHKCEAKIIEKRQQHEERMRNESDNCQEIIRMNRKSVAEELVVLEAEIKPLQSEFEKQVKINQNDLKNLRDEKTKLEFQLKASIEKYDSTIRQKMIRNMELHDELVKSQEELDKVMIDYHREAAIFNDIVVKFENEEILRNQRRILTYMMNRAARTIQRYWIKWRKTQRRKSRLEKKKIKKQLNKYNKK